MNSPTTLPYASSACRIYRVAMLPKYQEVNTL